MSDRNRGRAGETHTDQFEVSLNIGYDRRATFAMGVAGFEQTDLGTYELTGSGLRHPADMTDDPDVGKLLAVGRALKDLGTLMIQEAEQEVIALNGGA